MGVIKNGLISAFNATFPINPIFSQHDPMNSCAALQKVLLQSDLTTDNIKDITCEWEQLMLSGIGEGGVVAQDLDASSVSNIYSYI